MSDFNEGVKEFILMHHLISPKDRILLALSGGMDSVALFHVLRTLSKELDFELGAVHLNHGLRGEAADRDEAFVVALCEKFGFPCFHKKLDVQKIAKEQGQSFEAMARELRYDYFSEIMENKGYDKTAVAHHRDDQAETVLLNLMRGSGLAGLTGMKPQRGRYIRPMLEFSKPAIEVYLKAQGYDFCHDETNDEPDYLRNRIRLELLPLMESFQPQVKDHLAKTAHRLAIDEDALQRQMKKLAKEYLHFEGETLRLEEEAFRQHKALLVRLIAYAVGQMRGHKRDISEEAILTVLDLQRKETGKTFALVDLIFTNEYGDVVLSYAKDKGESDLGEVEIDGAKLPWNGTFGDYDLTLSHEPLPAYVARLDGRLVGEKLILRRRKPGDRLQPLGMTGRRRVSQILMDEKIPRKKREGLPLLQDSTGEILFLYPMFISHPYRIRENTDKILYINVVERVND